VLYIGFRFRHWVLPVFVAVTAIILGSLRSAAGRVALAAAKGAIRSGMDEYRNQGR
jgi:hypothetical protein